MRCVVPAAAIFAFACGGRSLPHPSYEPHLTSELAEVPYPPPPARIETVPNRPTSDALWIDGEWRWQGRRWNWRTGRWLKVPAGVAFSPWTLVRRTDGATFVAPGMWRNDKHELVSEPAVLAEGTVGRGSVVSTEGEVERTGLWRDGGLARAADTSDAGPPDGGPSNASAEEGP